MSLSFVEMNPHSKPTATVIWLHGLGADGHDFEPIVPQLGLPNDHSIRFVFPHAPSIPVTLNAGFIMPAWFDIYDLGLESDYDVEGIQKSEKALKALIEKEMNNDIPSEKIILAGFSQGGALALYTGLRFPKKLAGFIGLSTFLPLAKQTIHEDTNANHETPIFMAHGIHDPLVHLDWGTHTRDLLQKNNYQVEWHTYPIEHCVNLDEIRQIGAWLKKIIL